MKVVTEVELSAFEALTLVVCGLQPSGATAYDVERQDPDTLLLLGTKGRNARVVMRRLEQRGYLRSAPGISQKGRPVVRYVPTAGGLGAIRGWLAKTARVPVVDPETTIRLRARAFAPPELIGFGLVSSRPAVERALAEVAFERAKAAESGRNEVTEVLRFDLRRSLLETHLDWLKRVEKEIPGIDELLVEPFHD